jgi:hypothetical protein
MEIEVDEGGRERERGRKGEREREERWERERDKGYTFVAGGIIMKIG